MLTNVFVFLLSTAARCHGKVFVLHSLAVTFAGFLYANGNKNPFQATALPVALTLAETHDNFLNNEYRFCGQKLDFVVSFIDLIECKHQTSVSCFEDRINSRVAGHSMKIAFIVSSTE